MPAWISRGKRHKLQSSCCRCCTEPPPAVAALYRGWVARAVQTAANHSNQAAAYASISVKAATTAGFCCSMAAFRFSSGMVTYLEGGRAGVTQGLGYGGAGS